MDLLELGKSPISEQAPAGTDARSGPELEMLSNEMERLSSPTASGGTDWQKIADLSAAILHDQSKDLLVACYLATSLLRLEGLKGFGKGVHILKDLVEHFWEGLFPPVKRMRARRNALEWWLEKTAAALSGLEPGSFPQEEVSPLLEDLEGFDRFIREHMEDGPVLAGLLERVGSLQAPSPEEKGPPALVESATAAPAPQAAAPKEEPPSGAMQSEEDAQKGLRAASQRLSEVASFYMSRDLFHPLGYLLGRAAAWLGVTELPPSKGSKTLIPPPPEYVGAALEKLSREGDWEGLLQAAESRTGEFLFWLDLSHYSAEALERLKHPELSELVSKETALFVARLKGIEELCFADGTPFAGTETKAWLARFSLTGARNLLTETPSGPNDSLEDAIEREYQQALDLHRDGKLHEAVGMLHRRVAQGSSGKERMLWRGALSRFLIVAGEGRTALPCLREIVRDVAHHRLEEWDPGFALRILMGVYGGLTTLKDAAFKDETVEILDRIAALSPAEAMRLRK